MIFFKRRKISQHLLKFFGSISIIAHTQLFEVCRSLQFRESIRQLLFECFWAGRGRGASPSLRWVLAMGCGGGVLSMSIFGGVEQRAFSSASLSKPGWGGS